MELNMRNTLLFLILGIISSSLSSGEKCLCLYDSLECKINFHEGGKVCHTSCDADTLDAPCPSPKRQLWDFPALNIDDVAFLLRNGTWMAEDADGMIETVDGPGNLVWYYKNDVSNSIYLSSRIPFCFYLRRSQGLHNAIYPLWDLFVQL